MSRTRGRREDTTRSRLAEGKAGEGSNKKTADPTVAKRLAAPGWRSAWRSGMSEVVFATRREPSEDNRADARHGNDSFPGVGLIDKALPAGNEVQWGTLFLYILLCAC